MVDVVGVSELPAGVNLTQIIVCDMLHRLNLDNLGR